MTAISFSLTLSAEQVSAQPEQEGCCLETGLPSNKQCVRTTRDECQGKFYTGPPYDCSNVPECKPQSCIPKDKSEPCMRNKAAAECIAMGGVPDSRALEEIPQCKPGCCIIAKGVKAEVLQYRQCENLTKALGYELDMMEFKEGIVSEVECKKQGSPSDLGCCVLGGGDCNYGTRAMCGEGNFIPLAGGLFCRDVAACAVTSRNYIDCGKLPGTETDVYWFDSQGNQEELNKSCDYPEAICQKTDLGIVDCKETRCDLSDARGSQNITNTPPKVEIVELPTNSLLTGTSICYNFYTHYGDNRMQERSSGLQNQIIHCSFGEFEIEGLGTDRQKLCVPANASVQGPRAATFHANVKTNRWQNCSKCGEAKGLLAGPRNMIGDFFGPTWGIPMGSTLASIGSYCDENRCESGDYGDCVWQHDWGVRNAKVYTMAPIGSCNPMYPPGGAQSKCAECGGGGDAIWNLCTRAECYSLGDCQFNNAGFGRKLWTGTLLFVGLAWAERTPLIILDCLIACATGEQVIRGISYGACLPKCIGDRIGTYTLGTSLGILKFLVIDLVWNQMIRSAIAPAVTQAFTGLVGAGG